MGNRTPPTPSGSHELALYTKPGCHLCEEMKAVVDRVVRGIDVTLREVDISKDPELLQAYGERIPVLFVNGRRAFEGRLTERALRERLKGEASSE